MGPRSMSSMDEGGGTGLGMEMNWMGQEDWTGWNGMNSVTQEPWQDP